MTIEEAIRILEAGGWWDLLDPSGSDADLDPLDEAIDVALSALRAQQTTATLGRSRWEGCLYCDSVLSGPEWMIGSSRYCQFCGKPFTEDAWAELERRINGGQTD